jgi:hypothetical protein
LPAPVDYSSTEQQRDVYTLDQTDPLFRQKTFEKPSLKPSPLQAQPKPTQARPATADLPSSFYEANTESYLKARRVAEMKFNTIKLVMAFIFASAGLVAADVFLYPTVWWCYWPIAAWAFVLTFPIIKCFIFRGRDIRSVIETRIHKMALREVERFDGDL